MFRFVLVAVISCAMCLAVASPSVQGQSAIDARAATPERRDGLVAARYTMVDGHLHFLNFVQETLGMDALFAALDHAGVAEAVVLGMPLVKTWDEGDATRPTYYLDNDSRTYWYSATDFLVAHAVLSLPAQKRRTGRPPRPDSSPTARSCVRARATLQLEILAQHRSVALVIVTLETNG